MTTTNPEEHEYLKLLQSILDKGVKRDDRTGTGVISSFGERLKFSLRDGQIPILTTKRVYWKGVVEELLFFVKGLTNNKYLQERNVHIWDGNTSQEYLDSIGLKNREEGDLGPCFPAGTLVLTKNGYKKIEDVELEDKLYTHNGNWQKQASMGKKYNGELYTIKINYHPHISATAEHPFYVREFVKKEVRDPKHHHIVTLNEPKWLPIKDITKSHMIGMKIETREKIPEIEISKYVNRHTPRRIYKKKLDDLDLWYLMGFFLGDGFIIEEKNGPRIHFAICDKDIDHVLPRLNKNLKLSIKQKHPGCTTFRCYNLEVSTILKHFGKYAHGKKIPNWVHTAPKKFINAFLDGYIDSDGYIAIKRSAKNDSIRFTTVSADIAYSVQRLYLKLGKLATISFSKRGYKKEINGILCNQRDVYHIEIYKSITKRNNYSRIDDDYAWFTIGSITKNDVNDLPVYNFSVENDNTYTVCNTAVHNCYGYQWRYFNAEYTDSHTNYMGQGVDQLANAIELIKTNPTSRRIVVSAWNPEQIPLMCLPPCHILFQFYVDVERGELSCQMYQRSVDCFLGLPFNITSYALLTHMMADICGLKTGDLIMVLGDTHIYSNHIEQCRKQLEREPRDFPKLNIKNHHEKPEEYEFDDFELVDYKPHPGIKAQMAV
jgi:thymidylate synthase